MCVTKVNERHCVTTQHIIVTSQYTTFWWSMRTLLPLRSLLGEFVNELKLPPDFKSTISCRVFEDNNGALLLATSKQRITNRTKYFLVKWHFFWRHVTNDDVQVFKIANPISWPIISRRVSTAKLSNEFGSLHKVCDTRRSCCIYVGWISDERSLWSCKPKVFHNHSFPCIILLFIAREGESRYLDITSVSPSSSCLSQILSRESRTRTLFSSSTGYQKELQLLWYNVLINLSRHCGHCCATMCGKHPTTELKPCIGVAIVGLFLISNFGGCNRPRSCSN